MRRPFPLNLTIDQALSLAPDKGIIKSARVLAAPAKWSGLRIDAQQVAHGTFVVPRRDPFKTSVHLRALRFDCNCRNKKFPCNHAVALLLMAVDSPNAFEQTEIVEPDVPAEAVLPNEDAAKAQAKRQRALLRGLQEFERWLEDLARNGIATLPSLGREDWAAVAGRLVDNHAPALAREVRLWQSLVATQADWAERVLGRIGRIYLLLQAFKQLEASGLSEGPLWNDLHHAVGWLPGASKQDERLRDKWLVVGQTSQQSGPRQLREIWLYGRASQRSAKISQLSMQKRSAEYGLVTGIIIDATLRFHPSAMAQLASIEAIHQQLQPNQADLSPSSLRAASTNFALALGKNPWLAQLPFLIEPVQFVQQENDWQIVDGDGVTVPLWRDMPKAGKPAASIGWHLKATEGRPMFGLWNGETFRPLSLWMDGRLLDMALMRGLA